MRPWGVNRQLRLSSHFGSPPLGSAQSPAEIRLQKPVSRFRNPFATLSAIIRQTSRITFSSLARIQTPHSSGGRGLVNKWKKERAPHRVAFHLPRISRHGFKHPKGNHRLFPFVHSGIPTDAAKGFGCGVLRDYSCLGFTSLDVSLETSQASSNKLTGA